MKTKLYISVVACSLLVACGGSGTFIKNINNKAPTPKVSKENTFVLTETSKNPRYGFRKEYPVNIFYLDSRNDTINQLRYLNALAGPNGEKVVYKQLQNCCPFPTTRSDMGAGYLNVYELRWEGLQKPLILYLNIYEKGYVKVPVGLTAKDAER